MSTPEISRGRGRRFADKRTRIALAAAVIAALLLLFFVVVRDDPKTVVVKEQEEHEEESGPAIVRLSQAAYATAQIEVEVARSTAPSVAGPGLEVPAQVEFDPRRIAVVSPRTDARIERLSVVEGDRVRAGQVVALLQSKDYLVAQSDLAQAGRRAALLSGSPDARGAQALVAAARQRMRLLGASSGQISSIERGGEASLYLPVVAPFSGSVMKVHAVSGQAVHSGDPIFTIADLSAIDVVAEVPERSIALVRVGQTATVTLVAMPTAPFVGRVERLRDELNPETRTVRAVIHVSNSNGQLRPGMFASVKLAVSSTAYPELVQKGRPANEIVLTIPESAVVTDAGKKYVFVRTAPLTFERREVEIAPLAPAGSSVANSAYVLVRGGLKSGEQVVIRGAFTLKSELAKASLGEHGH